MTFAVAAGTAATAMLTAAAAASASGGAPTAMSTIRAVNTGKTLGHFGTFSATSRLAGASQVAPRSGGQTARHPAQSPSHIQVAGSAHGDAVTTAGRKTAGSAPAAPAKHAAPAKPAAPVKHVAHLLDHPYSFYDSVVPSAIPAHHSAAVYATGPYAASPSQLQGLGHTLWIDTMGKDYAASVLDVEPSDATPSQAANWVWHRLHKYPHATARVYTMISEWPAARAAIGTLPKWMQAHVHWWIADPTGVPHIVPGSQATQWYWGSSYDLSMAQPGF